MTKFLILFLLINLVDTCQLRYYNNINYNISWRYTRHVRFNYLLRKAFYFWSQETPKFNFTIKRNGDLKFKMKFMKEHKDKTVIAVYKNNIITVNKKSWKILNKKKDKLQVLIHEIGHAMGLAHSNFVESVMYKRFIPSKGIKFTLTDKCSIDKNLVNDCDYVWLMTEYIPYLECLESQYN